MWYWKIVQRCFWLLWVSKTLLTVVLKVGSPSSASNVHGFPSKFFSGKLRGGFDYLCHMLGCSVYGPLDIWSRGNGHNACMADTRVITLGWFYRFSPALGLSTSTSIPSCRNRSASSTPDISGNRGEFIAPALTTTSLWTREIPMVWPDVVVLKRRRRFVYLVNVKLFYKNSGLNCRVTSWSHRIIEVRMDRVTSVLVETGCFGSCQVT